MFISRPLPAPRASASETTHTSVSCCAMVHRDSRIARQDTGVCVLSRTRPRAALGADVKSTLASRVPARVRLRGQLTWCASGSQLPRRSVFFTLATKLAAFVSPSR